MTQNFKSYDDCRIIVVQKTPDPGKVCHTACCITQKKDFANITQKEKKQFIKFLLKANHTSVLEHCYMTVIISNISRSFLAQITRHRMGSFTSASQHYQEYDDYPNVLHPSMVDNDKTKHILKSIDTYYKYLICEGIPKEEARQILPNAKAVNIMWTVNARSLVNFLNLRMCVRNVAEMISFADIMSLIARSWWPDLFDLVGPDCFMTGHCNQGAMACEKGKKMIAKEKDL